MDEMDENFVSNLQTSESWLNNDITVLNKDRSNFMQLNDSVSNDKFPFINEDLADVQFIPSKIEYSQDFNVLDPISDNFLEDSYSELSVLQGTHDGGPASSMWYSLTNFDNFKMDEIFQVDKEEFCNGPTLAALNANDESLFDTFDDNATSPVDIKDEKHLPSIPIMTFPSELSNINGMQKCSNNRSLVSSVKNTNLSNKDWSCIQDEATTKLCFKTEDLSQSSLCVKSLTNVSNQCRQIKSEIAPEEKSYKLNSGTTVMKLSSQRHMNKKRNLVSQNLNEVSANVKDSVSEKICRISPLSTETFEFENTDDEESSSSSVDSYDEPEVSHKKSYKRSRHNGGHKEASYFWQYNTQAKGPRSKHTLCSKDVLLSTRSSTVHDYTKSRRSDGNDLTPCPQKLYNIGVELQKLNSLINNLTPVNAVPFNARPRCRKEKNKLASRVCRLKKKAQYEANKLKLYGLQQEHDTLLNIIDKVKEVVACKINSDSMEFSCEKSLEGLCSNESSLSVADSQTEFVNSILKNVESGDPTGGLDKWFLFAIKSKGD